MGGVLDLSGVGSAREHTRCGIVFIGKFWADIQCDDLRVSQRYAISILEDDRDIAIARAGPNVGGKFTHEPLRGTGEGHPVDCYRIGRHRILDGPPHLRHTYRRLAVGARHDGRKQACSLDGKGPGQHGRIERLDAEIPCGVGDVGLTHHGGRSGIFDVGHFRAGKRLHQRVADAEGDDAACERLLAATHGDRKAPVLIFEVGDAHVLLCCGVADFFDAEQIDLADFRQRLAGLLIDQDGFLADDLVAEQLHARLDALDHIALDAVARLVAGVEVASGAEQQHAHLGVVRRIDDDHVGAAVHVQASGAHLHEDFAQVDAAIYGIETGDFWEQVAGHVVRNLGAGHAAAAIAGVGHALAIQQLDVGRKNRHGQTSKNLSAERTYGSSAAGGLSTVSTGVALMGEPPRRSNTTARATPRRVRVSCCPGVAAQVCNCCRSA